jgi:hypothetical protein
LRLSSQRITCEDKFPREDGTLTRKFPSPDSFKPGSLFLTTVISRLPADFGLRRDSSRRQDQYERESSSLYYYLLRRLIPPQRKIRCKLKIPGKMVRALTLQTVVDLPGTGSQVNDLAAVAHARGSQQAANYPLVFNPFQAIRPRYPAPAERFERVCLIVPVNHECVVRGRRPERISPWTGIGVSTRIGQQLATLDPQQRA